MSEGVSLIYPHTRATTIAQESSHVRAGRRTTRQSLHRLQSLHTSPKKVSKIRLEKPDDRKSMEVRAKSGDERKPEEKKEKIIVKEVTRKTPPSTATVRVLILVLHYHLNDVFIVDRLTFNSS